MLVDTRKLVAPQLFLLFKYFLSVFHCFRPCERMPKHAFPGQNTQHRVLTKVQLNQKKC